MATDSSKSSVWSFILAAALVALGVVAIFLFVNRSSLPSAEQNTLAQAQGPLPPPARLPTPVQPVQQMAPEAQPVQQIAAEAQPAPQMEPQVQHAPQQQQKAPAQQGVTRLAPAAPVAPSQNRPAAEQPKGSCEDPEYAMKYC